jgi:hypothetical protein
MALSVIAKFAAKFAISACQELLAVSAKIAYVDLNMALSQNACSWLQLPQGRNPSYVFVPVAKKD